MLTRNGIAYDLTLSPYQTIVRYGKEDSIIYKFSSEGNRERFLNKLSENREYYNGSLSKRFNIQITCDKLSDLKLYSSVEKRGFLIETEEKRYTCLNTIRLDGMNLIQEN